MKTGVVSGQNCLLLQAELKSMETNAVFDRNTVEFVTVAAEYCAFLEQSEQHEAMHVIDVMSKLLPLLYLKASMLPEVTSCDLYLEEAVSEPDYDAMRLSLQEKFGEYDDYLEVFVEDMKYSDTPVRKCISEDLSDLWQALKNFIHSYRSGLDSVMEEAVAVCSEGFRSYWGQTLTNTLRAIHSVRYGQENERGGEEDLYD